MLKLPAGRSATPAEKSQMAHALVSAVIDLGVASTDDAHCRYELPSTVEPRAWGAIITRLLAHGVLRRVGDAHTRRRVAHGRRIGRYHAPDIATIMPSAAEPTPPHNPTAR